MACHAPNCLTPLSQYVWKRVTLKDICSSPHAEAATIEQMVEYYNLHLKESTENWLHSLTDGQPEDLWYTNFICGEANRLNTPPDNKFCKNTHQYRMPSATITMAREVLSKAGLERLSSFREILKAVHDATTATPTSEGVPHFGELACYDFTLRYGFHRGITPDTVYVHAGTRTGLKALQAIYPDITTTHEKVFGETVSASLLPEPISSLGNLHIENFLCIFDEHLTNYTKHYSQSNTTK